MPQRRLKMHHICRSVISKDSGFFVVWQRSSYIHLKSELKSRLFMREKNGRYRQQKRSIYWWPSHDSWGVRSREKSNIFEDLKEKRSLWEKKRRPKGCINRKDIFRTGNEFFNGFSNESVQDGCAKFPEKKRVQYGTEIYTSKKTCNAPIQGTDN